MKRAFYLLVLFVCTVCVHGQSARIVAHRGYWNTEGSAQNSIASLLKADSIGVWGSEFDVSITRDGVIVVNHDADIDGIDIEGAMYADLCYHRLKNGERLPLLEEYLSTGKRCHKTRLVLEIKPHKEKENETRCVNEVLREVKASGMDGHVDYISFSTHVCRLLSEKAPYSQISYLGSNLSPEEVKALGCTGIDFNEAVYNEHPDYISRAHALGLTVNVWTVNDLNTIWRFITNGVDFITTNRPVEAHRLSGEQ